MGILGLVGSIGGAIIGGINQRKAEQRQFENEKKLMGLQAQYNEDASNAQYRRNLAMWNATNYEQQVQHLKAAGLSKGLMYGNGGGQGASTAGGNAMGVTNGGTSAVQAGLEAKQIGLSLASIASQIKLNESQAEKNQAEADKTRGVDTEAQKATIDNILAETDNKKIQKGLILSQTRLNDANEELARTNNDLNKAKTEEVSWSIKNMIKGFDILEEQLNALKLDNKKKEAVLETEVEQSRTILKQMMMNLLETDTNIKLKRAETENAYKDIWVKIQTIAQGWMGKKLDAQQLRIEAQKVLNDIHINNENLKINKDRLALEVVTGLLKTAIVGAITKGKM